MKKSNVIYEARVPVTHNNGVSAAEWVIQVNKIGRTYSVCGTEHAFCHIDNDIIAAVFAPYEDLLLDMFFGLDDNRSVTKNAQWVNIGSANTHLKGVKNKDTALQIGKWLEAVASNSIKAIPSCELDRREILYKDVKPKAIDTVRNYATEVEVETIH